MRIEFLMNLGNSPTPNSTRHSRAGFVSAWAAAAVNKKNLKSKRNSMLLKNKVSNPGSFASHSATYQPDSAAPTDSLGEMWIVRREYNSHELKARNENCQAEWENWKWKFILII